MRFMVSSKLSFFGTQTGVQPSRKFGFHRLRLLLTMLLARLILPIILLTCSLFAVAEPVVENVRVWRAPDNTRLVFDLSGPISHSIFELSNPERLVIDLSAASFAANVDGLETQNTPVNGVRTGKREDGGLRVVLDLSQQVKPRTFSLSPNESYGNRLVVDLFDKKERVEKSVADLTDINRDIVIAIDAGHGGEDPGALGPGGVLEKDVVLGISKALKRAIDSQSGYSAVLVRTSDYYVPLRDRFAKAREHRADMFISIHADSFRMSSVRGASVYALSTQGATSEMASYLAQKENRADLIGGAGSLSLKDKDDQLASVLLDLSMNATLDSSLRLGEMVLAEMGSVTRLHKKNVEQAGFAVLKSPDVPSLLIETGFISNPEDARNLAQPSFQNRVAKSIFQGVRNYFDNYPPADTLVASMRDQGGRTYVIQSGDTLSEIAERFNVSLNSLQIYNNISSSVIRVGQQLSIPTT